MSLDADTIDPLTTFHCFRCISMKAAICAHFSTAIVRFSVSERARSNFPGHAHAVPYLLALLHLHLRVSSSILIVACISSHNVRLEITTAVVLLSCSLKRQQKAAKPFFESDSFHQPSLLIDPCACLRCIQSVRIAIARCVAMQTHYHRLSGRLLLQASREQYSRGGNGAQGRQLQITGGFSPHLTSSIHEH